MSREEKESIVGLVSSIVSCFHMELEQHKLTTEHGAVICENGIADALFGIKELGLRADMYIVPPYTDSMPIFIEVGKMKAGKWDAVLAADDKPLTIVHVQLDDIHIISPRNTWYEDALLVLLQDLLPLRTELSAGNRDAGTALHARVIQVVENIKPNVTNNPQQAGSTMWEVGQMRDTFGQIKTWLVGQDCTSQVNRAIKIIEKELDRLNELAQGRENAQ